MAAVPPDDVSISKHSTLNIKSAAFNGEPKDAR